jgi:hypothetical protein
MKIRMLADMSGTKDGKEWPKRGEVADFDAEEAAELIASGIAAKAGDKEAEAEVAAQVEASAPVEAAAVSTEPLKKDSGPVKKS